MRRHGLQSPEQTVLQPAMAFRSARVKDAIASVIAEMNRTRVRKRQSYGTRPRTQTSM
jgi:hypothetical protein